MRTEVLLILLLLSIKRNHPDSRLHRGHRVDRGNRIYSTLVKSFVKMKRIMDHVFLNYSNA